MGILDFIFRKSVKTNDPFFGEMLFVESKKDPSKNYFECRRYFKPSDKVIEIGIDGDVSGPTELQTKFFKEIEERYAEISESIIPLIEDQFQNWKEDFRINDFVKEFEPVYLRIPRCESKPIIWELAFESEHDQNHTFTLTMQDFQAVDILIDG